MDGISRALALERSGDYRGAVKSLMSILDDIEASSEWDRVFEWMVGDIEMVGENAEAAWHETAGRTTLAGDSSPAQRRVSRALFFVQGPHPSAQGAGATAR
jgi:hypothetical protein